MTTQELLRNSMLFRGSGKEEIEFIAGLFQERRIRPHSIIFSENMPAESLYLVKSGTVRVSMMASEGEELGLLRLGTGEFFGELALIQETNRLVTARADDDPVEILLLPRKDFKVLMEQQPRAAARALLIITKLLAMRIRTYGERLKEMLVS